MLLFGQGLFGIVGDDARVLHGMGDIAGLVSGMGELLLGRVSDALRVAHIVEGFADLLLVAGDVGRQLGAIVVQLVVPFAMGLGQVGLLEFHGLPKAVPQIGLGLAGGLFQMFCAALLVSHGRPPLL